MIVSVYNIHRNPDVWEKPEDFLPERFSLDDPIPNEQNTNFRLTILTNLHYIVMQRFLEVDCAL